MASSLVDDLADFDILRGLVAIAAPADRLKMALSHTEGVKLLTVVMDCWLRLEKPEKFPHAEEPAYYC